MDPQSIFQACLSGTGTWPITNGVAFFFVQTRLVEVPASLVDLFSFFASVNEVAQIIVWALKLVCWFLLGCSCSKGFGWIYGYPFNRFFAGQLQFANNLSWLHTAFRAWCPHQVRMQMSLIVDSAVGLVSSGHTATVFSADCNYLCWLNREIPKSLVWLGVPEQDIGKFIDITECHCKSFVSAWGMALAADPNVLWNINTSHPPTVRMKGTSASGAAIVCWTFCPMFRLWAVFSAATHHHLNIKKKVFMSLTQSCSSSE